MTIFTGGRFQAEPSQSCAELRKCPKSVLLSLWSGENSFQFRQHFYMLYRLQGSLGVKPVLIEGRVYLSLDSEGRYFVDGMRNVSQKTNATCLKWLRDYILTHNRKLAGKLC